MQLKIILKTLQDMAPLELAESWDNVGLLVGNFEQEINRIMTCLTVSEVTLQEAIDTKSDLIVAHHPIPFKPVSRITSDSNTGKLLLAAIAAGISIYSPHTAWDNAQDGINQQLADFLELESIVPLKRYPAHLGVAPNIGVGRCGHFTNRPPITIEKIIARLESYIQVEARFTHSSDRTVSKIGIVCGSGGSMIDQVAEQGCDAMLTGEATYHQCLEAQARGIAMILIGHHASEAFAMQSFAAKLQRLLPQCSSIFSKRESSRF